MMTLPVVVRRLPGANSAELEASAVMNRRDMRDVPPRNSEFAAVCWGNTPATKFVSLVCVSPKVTRIWVPKPATRPVK